MIYGCYNKIFNILLVVILLLSGSLIHAGISENSHPINSSVVVGLLKTGKEIYAHELRLSQDISKMFNNFGVKTVLIDYNKIINLKKIQEEFAKQDEMLARKLVLDQIKIKLAQFIEEHRINRIFVMDNLYSSSTPYCQLVTEAIIKIVDDNPTVHLLVICDGLQGIMDTEGIEVVDMANLVSNKEQQKSLKSAPNLQLEGIPFQQVKIVPNSRLAKVVAKFLLPNENGWFSICFPDAHSGTVSNMPNNRRKLELLGYKIVAFSSDGIIEAIEDKHGNIYFRSHPEALIVKSDKNLYLSNQKEHQVSTLVAIAIINDFLYHA